MVRLVPANGATPEHFKVRVRLADNSRPWIHLPPEIRTEEEARARAVSMGKTARAEGWSKPKQRTTPAAKVERETVDEWFARWVRAREGRVRTVRDDRSRYAWHVSPIIGKTYIGALTRDDIEDVRDALDEKIRAGYQDPRGRRKLMAPKMASNVWTLVTTMTRDMGASKDRSLRCREDDLAKGVLGPDRGERTAKCYVYPSEFLALVADGRAPIHHRRNYALALYLYVRLDELDVLRWEDVDLEHGYVHVRRALKSDGTIGLPKNGRTRRVPIEPALVPLLEAMKRESGGEGRVTRITQKNNAPALLRAYLERAVERAELPRRPELFDRQPGTKPLGFHDLRASGITWRAVRGDALQLVREHAGHKDIATTDRYIREADAIREGFGDVFPELPRNLIDPACDVDEDGTWTESRTTLGPGDETGRETPKNSRCQGRGSNPHALSGRRF